MAEKGSLSKKVIESDAFLALSTAAKALYFYIVINADHDGALGAPQKIMRMLQVKKTAFDELVSAHFLIAFDSGVVVVKHWRLHNSMRFDRYRPSEYIDEMSQIGIKENGVYTLDDNQMATKWQPNGNQMATKWQPHPAEKKRKEKKGKEKIGKELEENLDLNPPLDRKRLEELLRKRGVIE